MKTKKTKKIKPLRGGALARAAVNQILLHPKTWDQMVWHNECGTKHCFGGWCQILAGFPPDENKIWDQVPQALGIDDDLASDLFGGEITLERLYGFAMCHGVKRKDLKLLKE